MKKTLLLTTALVGSMALAQAAMAQEATTMSTTTTTTTETVQEAEKSPITVTLGGNAQATLGIVDDSGLTKDTGDSTRSQAFDTDVEAIVYADGKTDSGFMYGAQMQLLQDDNDPEEGDDQQFVYISDSWGKVEAGDADGAADKMAIYAPNDFGTGGMTGKYFQFLNSGTVFEDGQGDAYSGYNQTATLNKRYKVFDSETASKISYYTPRFVGIQAGVSYAPDSEGNGNRSDVAGASDVDSLYQQATRDAFENYIEAGLNYEADFDDIGFTIGGTYVNAEAKGNFNNVNNVSTNVEDLQAFQVGTDVTFMGFTFGGGYTFQGESGIQSNVQGKQDGKGYNLGLQYETGPFIVGINGLSAKNQGYGDKDNQLEVYSLGATYILAPGLSTFVEGSFASVEGSYRDTSAVNNTQNFDNDGTAFILGTKVEF